jgi:hypothetical protein
VESSEDPERSPLLHTHSTGSPYGYGSNRSPGERSYFATPPGGRVGTGTETDGEDDLRSTAYPSSRRTSVSNRGYTSCSDDQQFPSGYSAYRAAYALPSIPDQQVTLYRERVLLWGTFGCFAASFLLMAIATLLITTGRHKMRLEVDAGATLGIVASLGAACAGLCMTGSRRDKVSLLYRLAVWVAFAGSCVLNGVLLVMVMGNTVI